MAIIAFLLVVALYVGIVAISLFVLYLVIKKAIKAALKEYYNENK